MTISGKKHYVHPRSKSSLIPKHIYTYWHEKQVPEIVKRCMDSWKRFCPDYTIHLIHSGNIKTYMDTELTLVPSQAFLSDIIRLHVLSERGGIWMDASIYLNDSLDWLHGIQLKTGCEFIGYDQHEAIPHECIESWFLACIPHSLFIKEWKAEFSRVQSFPSVTAYIKDISKETNLDHLVDPEYLAIYSSSQRIIQRIQSYQLYVIDHHPHMTGMFPLFFQFIQYPLIKYTAGDRLFLTYSGLTNLL